MDARVTMTVLLDSPVQQVSSSFVISSLDIVSLSSTLLDIVFNDAPHLNSITACPWGEGLCCSCAVFGGEPFFLWLKIVYTVIFKQETFQAVVSNRRALL